MGKIMKFLLRLIQQRCKHPPHSVAADILQGDCPGLQVRWCKVCGAHQINRGEWRQPRPDWE